MINPKLARTEKWVKVEVSNALKLKVKNPLLHNLTITDVKVTKDLSYATIGWTIYGSAPFNVDQISRELEKVKGICRSELAKVSSSYKVPALRFEYDNTTEKANKIDDILKNISKKDD